MKYYVRLLGYLKPYVWPYFILGMVCMLAFGATDGAIPFLVQHIMDDVFARKDQTRFILFAAGGDRYFCLPWFHELRSELSQRLCGTAHHQRRQKSAQSPFSIPVVVVFSTDIRPEHYFSRVNSDVQLVRYAITDALASFLKDATSLVVLMVVAFLKDWVLASIAFFVFPASVLPIMRLSKHIKRFTRRGQISTGTLTALLQESIQGNRIVKAFGMESYEDQRFMQENWKLFKQSLRASRIKAIVSPSMELLASFAIGGVVWYGGWSVIAGGRTQGEFMAFMAAMFLMYGPFKGLSRTYTSVHQGLAGAERVFEMLDEKPAIDDKPDAREAKPFAEKIEFHDVNFAYADAPVLKRINLIIEAGQMVALVGMSGVGKSTLVDLIPRFYDVDAGSLTARRRRRSRSDRAFPARTDRHRHPAHLSI